MQSLHKHTQHTEQSVHNLGVCDSIYKLRCILGNAHMLCTCVVLLEGGMEFGVVPFYC